MLNQLQETFFNRVIGLNFDRLLLTGEAGCGKTFVLTQALAELHRAGKSVLLCAPTHMARLNLLSKMPEDVRPYVETSTVASLLSRVAFKTGDGGLGFSKPSADRINQWEVIAIDEVSMLSLNEYEVLKAGAAKIIFTGDFAQLPTIMQKGSGMMDDEDLEQIHLTEQMRQHGVIHQVAEANRESIYFPEKSMSDEESSVTVHASTNDLLSQMVGDIIADVNGTMAHDQYRLITYTNNTVYETGQFIRDMVMSGLGMKDLLDNSPFIPTERLLSYTNNSAAYNGEVVTVVGCQPDPAHIRTSDQPWDSYHVTILGSRGECVVNCVAPTDYAKIENRLEKLTDLIREAQKRRAYDAAAAYISEVDHIRNYWTKMLYPFVITCHKSQGSTIANVYVDTQSFAKAPNKRALLYVGLSRASKTLHTVKVEKPEWKVIREINTRYRDAKKAYEAMFNEPHWKVRNRTGLPARTPQEKLVLTEYLEALIADGEQDGVRAEAQDEVKAPTPTTSSAPFASAPTSEQIDF